MTSKPRASKRVQVKGRRESGGFVQVPHALIRHPNYQSLSLAARKVLDILWTQLEYQKGVGPSNNGWLSCTEANAEEIGLRSSSTIRKGVLELQDAGIIVRTSQGSHASEGRRAPNLFAITLWNVSDDQRSGRHPLELVARGTPIIGLWHAAKPATNQPATSAGAAPLGRVLEVRRNSEQCKPQNPS